MAVYIVIAIILIGIFLKPSKGIILFYLLSPIFREIDFLGQNIYLYFNSIIVVLYFLTHFRSIQGIKRNPFFLCIILMSLSLIISNYFGYKRHTPMTIGDILDYFSVFVVYDIVSKASNNILRFFVKAILAISFIICINGIIEVITKQNLLLQLFINTGLYDKDTPIITEVRFGLKRIQSVFQMHTTMGGFCFVCFTFLFYIKKYCGLKQRFLVFTIIMLVLCLFFTGARSAVVGLTISLLTFIRLKDLSSFKGLFGLAIVFIALFLLQGYINTIFGSIINSNQVGIGSSSDMRDTQFTICTYYFMQSPIVGNGISYIWETALSYDKEILGAESLWLPLMVDQGALGIISMIFIYLSILIFLKKHQMLKASFIVIGYLAFASMSSIPAVTEVYLIYFAILLVFCKGRKVAKVY